MFTPIHWIGGLAVGRLGIMARPRGNDWLDDEIDAVARHGVDLLVSLLTEGEALELGLADEARCCEQRQIAYISFPIIDRQTPPASPATRAVIQQIAQRLAQGGAVAIHCRMGVGRSALIAAAALTLRGIPADAALDAIAAARGCPVPDTPEQRAWVRQFAKE